VRRYWIATLAVGGRFGGLGGRGLDARRDHTFVSITDRGAASSRWRLWLSDLVACGSLFRGSLRSAWRARCSSSFSAAATVRIPYQLFLMLPYLLNAGGAPYVLGGRRRAPRALVSRYLPLLESAGGAFFPPRGQNATACLGKPRACAGRDPSRPLCARQQAACKRAR